MLKIWGGEIETRKKETGEERCDIKKKERVMIFFYNILYENIKRTIIFYFFNVLSNINIFMYYL